MPLRLSMILRRTILLTAMTAYTLIVTEAWAAPISGQKTVAATADAQVLTETDSDDASATFTPPSVGGVSASAVVSVGGDNGGENPAVIAPGGFSSASSFNDIHSGGRFFSSSSMFSGGGNGSDGEVGVTIQLPQYGGGDIEAEGSIFWKGIFVASDTVNHRFGFRIENMTLFLQDDSGLYDLTDPLVAELGGEIRFGFGTGALDSSDTIYSFVAELYAAGDQHTFDLDIFNPTGAAVPTFSGFSLDNFHMYTAPNFDAFVNLGLITGGQTFTLEYHAFTYVSSPGTIDGGANGSIFGNARFGDPFDPNADPNIPNSFSFQTTVIPEPSSILVFAVVAGVFLGTTCLRRRKTKTA